jgi:glycosyltransferase involved in cell wall biosynthesis
MDISIIIPTYNRCHSLSRTLESLENQNFPPELFEVIVVDDGSSDDTIDLAAKKYSFPLKYCRQANQGSAAARNLGARSSQGLYLVFLDDDVEVEPHSLFNISKTYQANDRVIIQGSLVTQFSEPSSTFKQVYAGITSTPALKKGEIREISYRDCLSTFLSVKREHFFEIGEMQDVGGDGRTAWGDTDFGYRAYRKGFKLYLVDGVTGFHHDSFISDLWSYADRWERTAYMAVKLIRRYPEVIEDLPMFADKTPIDWGKDPLRQVISKWIHGFMTKSFVIRTLHQFVRLIDRHLTFQTVLRPLYRLVLGVHLTRGFRAGLRDFPLESQSQ